MGGRTEGGRTRGNERVVKRRKRAGSKREKEKEEGGEVGKEKASERERERPRTREWREGGNERVWSVLR